MRVRNHALDGLRGLAALGILTLHVWMFTVQGAHGRDELVSLLTGELRLGVVLFFVLSGYLLAGPWVASALEDRPTPRLGRFAVRRAARIVPGYWVAMLGSFWLLRGSGHDFEISAGQLPLFAAFGQNYVASAAGRLDPPMWSLVVEVSFYAVLPLAGWLLVRCAGRGRMVVACAGLAALGVAWGAAGALLAWPDTAMSTLPTFLPVFACGMAAAALAHRRVPSRGLWWGLALSGAVLVFLDAWWHHQGTGMTGHVVRDLPAALGFAAVVAAVAAHPPGVLSRAPLRGLGTISYGLYLWHLPVLLWLRFKGLMPGGFVLPWLEVTALAALVAYASWVLVERPAIEAAGRWRPWSRRVPSFPAERHVKPVPSMA
ncbi:MAG TPA: acyltransferase [Solirubrobacteraceae bacterium]